MQYIREKERGKFAGRDGERNEEDEKFNTQEELYEGEGSEDNVP